MSAGIGGALTVAVALFAGWWLAMKPRAALHLGARKSGGLPHSGSARRGGIGATRVGWPGFLRGESAADPARELQGAAVLISQLAALLRAGRTPVQVWSLAARTHADLVAAEASAHSMEVEADGVGRSPQVREGVTPRVLAAAARAASLGRPVAHAIRDAASSVSDRDGGSRGSAAARGVWLGVSACIEAAEASGSPLAGVLDRFAAQLESDADAAAARSVALAGPKATAQVLSVLPLAGLGLGMLMGADPLGLLLSTPLGALCLGAGFALTVLGRWWSARLVRTASEAR